MAAYYFLPSLILCVIIIALLARFCSRIESRQIERYKNERDPSKSYRDEGYQKFDERNIDVIARHLNALRRQLHTQSEEKQRQESSKTSREWVTIFLIFATAIFTFSSNIIFYFQYKQMQSSSEQTNKLIEDTAIQANATADSVNAFINSERGELALGSVTLNNVTGTDPTPTISFNFTNLGHSAVTISDIYLECYIIKGPLPEIPTDANGQTRQGDFSMSSNTSYGTDSSINGKPAQYPCYLSNILTPNDWQSISNGTETIFFGGFVKYSDIFNQYVWHFGVVYSPEISSFTSGGLPALYNTDNKED